MDTPELEYLAVVSDLHLAPDPAMSLFSQEKLLANWISSLAGRKETPLGLVLAGDIFDFLADPAARPFNPRGASTYFTQILNNYPLFFSALKSYLAGEGRYLVILAGNHDVELALDNVLDLWLANLGAPNRIHTVLAGEGYTATVAGRKIRVVHGNEADSWNIVDYEAVRRTNAATLGGQPAPLWAGNPGANLVTAVLNPAKLGDPAFGRRARPFVDMLLPAGGHFLTLLPALDPGLLRLVARFDEVLARMPAVWSQQGQWLGGTGQIWTSGYDLDMRFSEALANVKNDVSPRRLAAQPRYLSKLALAARAFKKDPFEMLRWSWRHNWYSKHHATTRDIKHLGDDDAKIIQVCGGEVDFLVAGHTHAARCIERGVADQKFHYFNSGTWIDLLQIEAVHLGDTASFAPVRAALEAETPDALRKNPIVRARPTVVTFSKKNSGAVGQLWQLGPGSKKQLLGELEA